MPVGMEWPLTGLPPDLGTALCGAQRRRRYPTVVAADDQRAKNGLTQGGFSAWRDLPTDEQIAVHIQDIALNLFVSDVTKEDAVNNSIPAASSTNESIDPNVVDGIQALRPGLGLMIASQLTMVRFQLPLYKSNPRQSKKSTRLNSSH